jgi:beta-N-acetylhexosaminidase
MKNSAGKISISSLSLREKISQMLIVKGDTFEEDFVKLGVGGLLLGKHKTKKGYVSMIKKYQDKSKIKMFVSADMEGYWNSFADFYKSKSFVEIKDGKEALILGKEHGKILKELGFNLNFSPVVEPAKRNTVWPGRSFSGSEKEVNEKISAYIKGLRSSGILATAKHYPGGSMVKDPHKFRFKTRIFPEDLRYFDHAIKNKVDAIMVGHPIVYGAVDSKGKQCTLSPEIISGLKRKFNGLIIADAITMLGLRLSYLFRFNKIYIDLVKAGNDIIIDTPLKWTPWSSVPRKIKKRIEYLERAVKRGEISEKRIDESVRKILKAKGYKFLS